MGFFFSSFHNVKCSINVFTFNQQAYDDFEHNQTMNHPENFKILQSWKSVLDSYNTKPGREKALIVTAEDDLNATTLYFDAGVTIVRITPLSQSGSPLAERIETKLKDASDKRVGWMVSIRTGLDFVFKTHPPLKKKEREKIYSTSYVFLNIYKGRQY